MTQADATRLKNLRLKKKDGKRELTPLDLHFLKKLTEMERQERREARAETPSSSTAPVAD